jgi:hypothetical protein
MNMRPTVTKKCGLSVTVASPNCAKCKRVMAPKIYPGMPKRFCSAKCKQVNLLRLNDILTFDRGRPAKAGVGDVEARPINPTRKMETENETSYSDSTGDRDCFSGAGSCATLARWRWLAPWRGLGRRRLASRRWMGWTIHWRISCRRSPRWCIGRAVCVRRVWVWQPLWLRLSSLLYSCRPVGPPIPVLRLLTSFDPGLLLLRPWVAGAVCG